MGKINNFLIELFFPTFCFGCQKEGIYLIDVPVDYSENYTVLVKELKEKVNLENEK